MFIGYAHVSTDGGDLASQRNALATLGVDGQRVYVDPDLTGTGPGFVRPLAACRLGDTLVVKADQLARPMPDARTIADELTSGQVKLSLGGRCATRPTPSARLLSNVLAII